MFLYFLQRTGHLAGDPGYLPGLLARWRRESDELRARAGAALPPFPATRESAPPLPRRPGGGTAGETAGGGGRGRRRRSGASFDASGPRTFYRCVLEPLFFGALNTRPERRDERARALGELPYLNGGLFERHALERRFPRLDLPDLAIAAVFDELLERYRFTARDAAEAAAEPGIPVEGGIDPEMLGRVFEELMAADRRGATGTYYTPAPVVARLVREALGAYMADRPRIGPGAQALKRDLAEIRVLDPACGSGAFLLGALSQLVRLRAALGDVPPGGLAELRRQIIGRSLHGVDLQEDAALLCALRLWLALAVGPADEEVVGVQAIGGAGAGPGAAAGPGADGRARSVRAATDGPTASYAPVPPLPNLDRRIRQGDALVDPLDLVAWPDGAAGRPGGLPAVAADVTVRQAIRAIGPLAARYLTAGPEEKPELQRQLASAEAELAGAWISALDRRLRAVARELRADAATRDLFGERPPEARAAEAALEQTSARLAELGRLRTSLEEAGALPFFSFGVHFAEAAERGFDLVLSNPPWVRAHRWPAAVKSLVRRRYAVCRSPGWRRGAELAGAPAAAGAQVDLSLLFLERAIRLLAPGGVLAMLLPAKMLRSMYGAGGRRLLLAETDLVALEDHSLDQRAIFRADAFAAAVVARKRPGAAPPGPAVPDQRHDPGACRVTMTRRGVPPLRFEVRAADLPLVPGDPDSPWLLAPPDVARALRRMQAAGPPLGSHEALRVHRGVVTGANAVLLVREAKARLGDLASIRAEGYAAARADGRGRAEARRYEAVVELDALRPLVRGADISAWRCRTAGWVVWCHDDATAAARPAPPRAARYLARHADVLRARSGWHPSMPLGALFRLTPETLRPKVAWHDLAETVKAVALPARIRSLGRDVPLIPLNTVYFIAAPDDDAALLLAALLNSLPVRTFARAIAERAKDARFRFQAWSMALLPLPPGWEAGRAARTMLRISREAHGAGAITPARQRDLDLAVAGLYGLDSRDMEALAGFDRWLRGQTERKAGEGEGNPSALPFHPGGRPPSPRRPGGETAGETAGEGVRGAAGAAASSARSAEGRR